MRPLWFKFCMPFIILPLLLNSCASLPSTTEKRRTIAVWYIEDFTPFTKVQPDLGEILMIEIIETLKKRGTYDEVIERKRLDLALEELRLGGKMFVDEETRLKIGKILGARYMVFGAYQVHGNIMRIDLRLVEVETGSIRKGISKTPSGTDLTASREAARKAAEEL